MTKANEEMAKKNAAIGFLSPDKREVRPMTCAHCKKENTGPYLNIPNVGTLCISCACLLYESLSKLLSPLFGRRQ